MTRLHSIILTISFLFVGILAASSQGVSKGFKKLEKLDYDKAQSTFLGAYIENQSNVDANYGLAQIYSNEGTSYYNLFQAYHFANNALLSKEKITKAGGPIDWEFFSEELGAQLKSSIEKSIVTRIRDYKNPLEIQQFINECSSSNYLDEVIDIRITDEFESANANHTVKSFNNFIEKYPDSYITDTAILLRDAIAFKNALKTNLKKEYYNYISFYPKSKHTQSVINMVDSIAFNEAITENTIPGFENYLIYFPNSKWINNAQRLLDSLNFEFAIRQNSIQAYNNYIHNYPQSIFVDSLLAERDNLAFTTIISYNNVDSLQKFIHTYPNSANFNLALQNRSQLDFRDAKKNKYCSIL